MKLFTVELKVSIDKGSFIPVRAHREDAGLDLFTPICVKIPAHDSVVIDTGVHVQLPVGTAGFLKSKSGLNVNHSITSEGVIDEGYTGSIKAKLYNHSDKDYVFERGDKITQLVITSVLRPEPVLVQSVEGSDRGDGGFGSTGR